MFNFSRRINGRTYYSGLLIEFGIIVATIMLRDLVMDGSGSQFNAVLVAGIVAVALIIWVYGLCLTRQRANDIGWHPLIVTIAAYSTPLFLFIGFIPGQKSSNKYGPVPKNMVQLT